MGILPASFASAMVVALDASPAATRSPATPLHSRFFMRPPTVAPTVQHAPERAPMIWGESTLERFDWGLSGDRDPSRGGVARRVRPSLTACKAVRAARGAR